MAQIKFLWNGIKIDGEFYRCMYSVDSGAIASTVTLYADDWRRLPRLPGLEVYNDSDAMHDYIDCDTIRIRPGTEYHADALAAWRARQIHDIKLSIKHAERMLAKRSGTRMESFYRRELDQAFAQLETMTVKAEEV